MKSVFTGLVLLMMMANTWAKDEKATFSTVCIYELTSPDKVARRTSTDVIWQQWPPKNPNPAWDTHTLKRAIVATNSVVITRERESGIKNLPCHFQPFTVHIMNEKSGQRDKRICPHIFFPTWFSTHMSYSYIPLSFSNVYASEHVPAGLKYPS